MYYCRDCPLDCPLACPPEPLEPDDPLDELTCLTRDDRSDHDESTFDLVGGRLGEGPTAGAGG